MLCQGTVVYRRGEFEAEMGAEAVIDFQLSLSSVTEAVTVTAQVPVVQTTEQGERRDRAARATPFRNNGGR